VGFLTIDYQPVGVDMPRTCLITVLPMAANWKSLQRSILA